MFKNTNHLGRWLVIAVAIGLMCCSTSLAKKPPGDAPYTLVDLLGLPGDSQGDIESGAVRLGATHPDGSLLIVGHSHVDGVRYPTAWHVNSDGSFSIEQLVEEEQMEDHGMNVNDYGEILVLSRPTPPPNVQSIQRVLVPTESTESGYFEQELPLAGGATAWARAINNDGVIVGQVFFERVNFPTTRSEGAVWQLDEDGIPGDPTLLTTDEIRFRHVHALDSRVVDVARFFPEDISDSRGPEEPLMIGRVLEFLDGAWDSSAAVAWFEEVDGAPQLLFETLDELEGFESTVATAISRNGQWICGRSYTRWPADGGGYTEVSEAFLASKRIEEDEYDMVGLGTLGGESSRAMGVNSSGQVIGQSDTGGGKHYRTAFLWQDGQMFDLNDLIDTKSRFSCSDINDSGDISGYLEIPRPVSETHAALLIRND